MAGTYFVCIMKNMSESSFVNNPIGLSFVAWNTVGFNEFDCDPDPQR
jgi:hypothetical protein